MNTSNRSTLASVKSTLASIGPIRRVWRSLKPIPIPEQDQFLSQCQSIIHVGANSGGERYLYESIGLDVLWVEAIPSVYNILCNNIRSFKNQRALNALVADVSGRTYSFHVASNDGASSSIFEFGVHERMYPEVRFESTLELVSETLDNLASSADAIVLDIQGAELTALKGAPHLLSKVKFVKVEAADFQAYAGGCSMDELEAYLLEAGFHVLSRFAFETHPEVGSYYDLVFAR